jgi:hypothetical protein
MSASGAASDGDVDRQQPTLERLQQVAVEPAAERHALPLVPQIDPRHTDLDPH